MLKAPATIVVGLAILMLTVAGCGNQTRPSVEEWRPVWEAATDSIPTAAELGEPPDQGLCGSTLATLREHSPDLFPTPDLAVDSAVRLWIRIAEESFFECPPRSAQVPSLDFAFGELDRLEAEVNAALAIGKGDS